MISRFTLENYFQIHEGKAIDFRIRVQKDQNNQYSFYIHPQGIDGETWDFKVIGNFLECTTATSENLNSLLVDGETLENLDKNVLFLMIKKLDRDREELENRVKELEQFQRDYENWQMELRDRGE